MIKVTSTKYKVKSYSLKFKILGFLILLSTFYFLLSTSALAHTRNEGLWRIGQPIVPCGRTLPGGGQCIIDPQNNTGECFGGSNGGNTCFDNSDCGNQQPCTQCQLWHLLKHLIDFVLVAAAPILATLFFIIAGVYIMLGGANPGMLSTGKSIFKNTFIGILIVMLSWLITNTLIQSLADPTAIGGNWYEYSCTP